MNYFTQLEILYSKADGSSAVNLLSPNSECKHKFELLHNKEIQRLCNGQICKNQTRSAKRRLIVEGAGGPPDIWQIPLDSVLEVITGARFYSTINGAPDYAYRSSIRRDNNCLNYQIILQMVTANFTAEYDELEAVFKWKWSLEEA